MQYISIYPFPSLSRRLMKIFRKKRHNNIFEIIYFSRHNTKYTQIIQQTHNLDIISLLATEFPNKIIARKRRLLYPTGII